MLLSRQKKSRAQDKLVFKKFKKMLTNITWPIIQKLRPAMYN